MHTIDGKKQGFLTSIRAKATALAIGIGVVSALGVGGACYQLARDEMEGIIREQQQLQATQGIDKIQQFITERAANLQLVTRLRLFRVESVRRALTPAQKNNALQEYVDAYKVFETISFIDLQGKDEFFSRKVVPRNHSKEDYFQEPLRTGKLYISPPRFLPDRREWTVYISIPVKDSNGKLMGVVVGDLPAQFIENTIKDMGSIDRDYYIFDRGGNLFITSNREVLGKPAAEYVPGYREVAGSAQPTTMEVENSPEGHVIATYVPWHTQPDTGWGFVLATNEAVALAPINELSALVILTTILVVIFVGGIATWLTQRSLKPVLTATEAVQKISGGNLGVRIPITGGDEIATLSENINQLVDRLNEVLAAQCLQCPGAKLLEEASQKTAEIVPEVQGVCFAAEEVIRWTLQSTFATSEMKRLIQEILTQSSAGESESDKLTKIATMSAQVDDLLQEIARSAEKQFRTASHVQETITKTVSTLTENGPEASEVATNAYNSLIGEV